MRKRWLVLGAVALIVGALYLANASLFAAPSGELTVLSHRGVTQRFSHVDLDNETCTATRIYPPTHGHLENTLPSMRAAFAAGADMVEIDIHPTTDGEFAVFHDWTIDCRTNGQGVTREQTMAYLRTLDVGYGYTADGGRTFPFRGKGVGMMPTLREVLAAFPSERFLINFKGGDPAEADALVGYLRATPDAGMERLAYYGASPADRVRELVPEARTLSRRGLMRCGLNYILTGWYGNAPAQCRDTIIFVPANLGWLLWGWPNRFLERMQAANTEVYVVAPLKIGERPGLNGIDDAATFAGSVRRDWRGGVATDAIEVIGPLARARR